jgi:putative thiamine transport system permease protein
MKHVSVALLCVLSLVPVAAGLAGAAAAGFDPMAWRALLVTPGLAHSLLLSMWTGLAATAISLALAHSALALAITGGWSGRLRAIALPMLASPHLALGIGLVLVLSPSGLLLRALSPWVTGFEQPPDWATVQDPFGFALICGLVVKETPFLVLVLFGALAQVTAEKLMLQASALGYGRLKAWMVCVAPLLQRQVRLATAAVLIFAITNVEVALPLGPAAPPTFSVLLLTWFTDADLAIRAQAFAGTWLLLGATVVCLAIARAAYSMASVLWRRWATSGHRAYPDTLGHGMILAALLAVFGLGLLALVALVLRMLGGAWRFPQLLPGNFSLSAWRSVAPDLGLALTTTLVLGSTTVLVSLALVVSAAEALHDRPGARRRVGRLLFVPLLLPQMAFLFGWQVVLIRMGLDGTGFAVLWSHAIFAFPYVWAVIAAARSALNPGYLSAARVLGAGSARAWVTVTAPLLLRSMLLAAALAFSVSAAVYLPTLFAGAGRVATLATEAAASASSGNIGSAAASGAAQVLAPLGIVGLTLWFGHAVFRNRRGVPR